MDLPLVPDEILDFPNTPSEPYPNRQRDSERAVPVYSPQSEFQLADGTTYQMTSSFGGRISSFSPTAAAQNKIYLLTIDGITAEVSTTQPSFYDLTYTFYKADGFCTLEQLVSDFELSNYGYELIIKTLKEYIEAEVAPSTNENWNSASELARRNVRRILEGMTVVS